ncbi:MAG: S49 family peptidase [Pseudomonadota bacterium]
MKIRSKHISRHGNRRIVIIDLAETITNQTSANLFKLLGDISLEAPPAGIILRITSLGGSLGAAQSIVESLDAVAAETGTLIYVVVEQSAISAAFFVAVSGYKVFATGAANIGAVGAVTHRYNIQDLLGRLGIRSATIMSGDEKTAYDRIIACDAEAASPSVNALVAETFQQFIEHIAARRHLPREALSDLGDGRVISGRQALALGLIDHLGGIHAGIAAMITEAGLVAPEIEYVTPTAPDGLVGQIAERLPLGFFWKWLFKGWR